jgi:hypothetical protein
LPEALARMRREPTLSAPAPDAAPRRANPAPAVSKPKRWPGLLPRTLGGYVALLFSAALIGVVVNAVGFQHERHPAPLVGAEPAASPPAPSAKPPAAPAVDASPAAAPAAQPSRLDAAPLPVARPPDRPAKDAAAAKKPDAITDLLRNGGGADSGRELVAAQRALMKLGYDIEADGVMGEDTLRALRDFEKSHSLPLSSEITPRLLAKLNSAAH